MEHEIGTWDSVLLENLTEDCFISNIHQRYKRDHIYTYIGTSVVAVNPYRHISENSLDIIHTYGSKGLFQLPPHIYGLANFAYQTLKDQNEDQCIILSGESGSGKTESFKMIVNFLTRIQESCTISYSKNQASTDATSRILRRRGSNSSSVNLPSSRAETSSAILRRKSSSPVACFRCDSSSALIPLRAESSERNSKKIFREKMVDFDFSRHKSSEYISESGTHASACRISAHSSSKSCFKNRRLPLRTSDTQSTMYLSTTGISGCRLCGHSGCNRAKSRQQEEILPSKMHTYRGSCSNLEWQQSMESQTHDLCTDSDLQQDGKPIQISRVKSLAEFGCNVSQKLRECVTCADVFLEAMGNAATLMNNNSSRYGKLFDIEIDFKGDPVGVHLTPCKRYILMVSQGQGFQFRGKISHVLYPIHEEIRIYSLCSCVCNNLSCQLCPRVLCLGTVIPVFNTRLNFNYMPSPNTDILEKSRVTDTNPGERNFHIFYQLLRGADMQLLKSLKLYRNVESYELLKNTTAFEEDRVNFHYTKKSLEILGLSSVEINAMLHVISSVLKLGNLIFVPVTNIDGTEGCQISNLYEIQETAQLLKVDDQNLLKCLTRGYTANNFNVEDLGFEVDARQASSVRSTLCRNLYSRLFTWLVNKINDSLKSTKRERKLALLDFYGFELLGKNSVEQLIINYSSERIHQNFLCNTLKAEQDLYLSEGLEWLRIDFFDNESICELLDKPSYGILSLINEPHLNSDEALLLRIQQCCTGHPNFMTSGTNSVCFKIRHFANVVNYNIHQFLEKNSDVLPKYMSTILYQSKSSLVQNLFPEGNPRRQVNKKPITLSCNVRTQLQTLLSIIKNRRFHYVFCIKPNSCKQPHTFEMALVQHQVRYMSLMPLVNLCRMGHCFHMPHAKFFNRYKTLNSITWPHFQGTSTIEGIALIIRNVPLPSAEFTIGTKNVFVRSPRTEYELEQFRKTRLHDFAILLQKTFRMYRLRKRFVRMRESQIVISSAWRTWRECRFGIPFTRRRHLWSLYRIAREEFRTMKYKKQVEWATYVISRYYRRWKIRQYLLTLPLCLPTNTLSPLSTEWPMAPRFLAETSELLRTIYHRWKCYVYRTSFDQTSRNRMREKVTASIIFKDRKASYSRSVGHPFVGDYVRLRHNQQWRRMCSETNDQYVVFADIINKITRSSGKFVPVLLVLSTSSLLLLDQRTLQVKYRVPAAEIYRMSLSPYMDNIAVFHVKASDFGRKKGDFIFQTEHVIEIVTKMFLVIQNATGKPPEVHISTEFEANFGHQTVTFSFKYGGMSEITQGQPKVLRKANRMEVTV